MDDYNCVEDMKQLLRHLDSVSIDDWESTKRSFRDCINNTKDAENLKALVIYYLKFNSHRALDILVGVREPHDRNLFDILVEFMKQPTHRQQSLILISHIVHKSPAWLPKIIINQQTKVLQSFFTILKTDQEVVPIVTSLLILVELISTLPSIMYPCLSDIFECFSRLCYTLAKQSSPNTTPQDFNTLHLHACVYRLFHRLYALYPCNFLAYLRSTYGSHRDPNKENIIVFNEILKPMLQRVRLHPLLVTAAKETECSNTRWINMEPHDILIECAKLALDPIEGIQEECDFCSDMHLCCSTSLSSDSSHEKCRISFSEEPINYFKTNQSSIIDQKNSELKNKSEIVSIGSMIKNLENKPKEYEFENIAKQTIPVSDSKIVVQNPKIIKNYLFDDAQEAVAVDNDVKELTTTITPSTEVIHNCTTVNESQQKLNSSQTESLYQTVIDEEEDNEVSEITANAYHLSTNLNTEGPMTPFISTTCYLTDNKREYVCPDNESRTDETNDLVGNIKSSFRHANSRLRYQSQCVPSPELMTESFIKSSNLIKSKSCPNICFNNESEVKCEAKNSKLISKTNENSNSIVAKNMSHDSVMNKSDYSRISSMNSSINCNCNCLGFVNSEGIASQRACNCTCTGNVSLCQYLYQYYKDQSRNTVHRTASKISPVPDRQHNLSPLEILNRHLTLGTDICLKEMNNPLTSKRDTDWSHFGGHPPNDEMNALKNQISLMYAQLLFERQQRESHATRNRRLLKKAKECIALQETFSAQTKQLYSQEEEIKSVKKEINKYRENIQNLEYESSVKHKRLEEEVVKSIKKCHELEDNNRELKENINLYKEQTKVLHLNYQKLEAKNLELEEDLKRSNKQNAGIEVIKKDNKNLKTQVLILSELYQGLKDRYSVINKNASLDEILSIESEARNREYKEIKSKLETTSLQMETYKMKCSETESLLTKKDNIIAELKLIFENNKSSHKTQLQVENQRIEALKKINQHLEQHILCLYGELGMREHEHRLRQLESNPSNQTSEESNVENNSHSLVESNGKSFSENHSYSNGNHN